MRMIAIRDLGHSPRNVRTAPVPEEECRELAASIRAHGLLSSLVVAEEEGGAFGVVAGGRRLTALRSLVEAGEMSADEEVHCIVLRRADLLDASYEEVSLAENQARLPLHPADQVRAFREMAREGADVEGIANRFGYAPRTVEAGLRLANVPEEILDAYAVGMVDREAMQQFATADTERALSVYRALKPEVTEEGFAPQPIKGWDVRDALDETRVSAASGLGSMVTAEYEAAGHPVDRDLFSERDHTYLADRQAAASIAGAILRKEADRLVAEEGWAWVDAFMDFPYELASEYEHAAPEARAEPTEEEAARIAEINERTEAIAAAGEYDEAYGGLVRERAALQAAIGLRDTWPKGTGCVVSVGDGMEVRRGLWRPGEAPRPEKAPAAEQDNVEPPRPLDGMNRKARENLRRVRTHVVRAHLDAATARDLLAYVLTSMVFGSRGHGPLSITGIDSHIADGDTLAYMLLRDRLAALPLEWMEAGGEEDGYRDAILARWEAFLDLAPEQRDELMACSVAALVRPQLAADVDPDGQPETEAVAAALGIDWATIRPTVPLLWQGMRKDAAIRMAREALGDDLEPGVHKLAKPDLGAALEAAFAEGAPAASWVIPGLAPVPGGEAVDD